MDNQLVRFTVFYAASLLLCPLLAGVINKVKAFFAVYVIGGLVSDLPVFYIKWLFCAVLYT